MTFGNLVNTVAYRITAVMPFFAILAADALMRLLELGLDGLGLRRRAPAVAAAAVVAALGVYNLNYYFLNHIPSCRYLGHDGPTSAVSMGMQYNFDPKGLMPCSWTWGGIWYTGTLFLYPLVFIAVPFLMISTVRILGRTGLNSATVISMAALLISLLMFLVTPGYFNWFMD